MGENAKFKIGDIVFKKIQFGPGILASPLMVTGVEREESHDTYKVQISDNYWEFEDRLVSLSEAIKMLDELSKYNIALYLNGLKGEYKRGKKIHKLKKAFEVNAGFEEIKKIFE